MVQYNDLFMKENVDLEMLTKLTDGEYMDMFKELGINSWGHRHKLKKAVQVLNSDVSNKAPMNNSQPDVNHLESNVTEESTSDCFTNSK